MVTIKIPLDIILLIGFGLVWIGYKIYKLGVKKDIKKLNKYSDNKNSFEYNSIDWL